MDVSLGARCTPVFGPPGTGKTHTLLGLIDGLLRTGVVASRELAFFTFTRNARAEALERLGAELGLGVQDLPWCRTIHSAALELVRGGAGVMSPKDWREFAQSFGYDLSEDAEAEDEPYMPPGRTAHDELRAAHGFLRNRMLDPGDVGRAPQRVPVDLYRLYVRRFEEFKRDRRLMDFTDFLELALRRRARPPVRVVFIDEAQDLSPLQQAVVTMWSEGCEVYTAGDDDQAIFSFQGANPEWLIGLYRSYGQNAMLLEQSRRVPRAAHALAETIVGRNRERVPKRYRPRENDGSVRVIDVRQAVEEITARAEPELVWNERGESRRRKTYLLARNWRTLVSWREVLDRQGIVYSIARGSSPMTEKRRRAVVAAQELLEKGSVMSTDLESLLDLYPSSGTKTAPPLGKRGIKKWVREHKARVYPLHLQSWQMGPWLEYLRQVGPAGILEKEDRRVREYLDRALRLYGGRLPALSRDSGLHLSTIHSTKGNEADTVMVLSDMATASHKEFSEGGQVGFEAENRVAYVGVTRTRDELLIVKPEDWRRHYPYAQMARSAGVVA